MAVEDEKGAKFTPTERRILSLLSDGLSHTREETLTCLNDEKAAPKALRVMLFHLRRKLRPLGQDIVTECSRNRKWMYRRVRLYTHPDRE